MYPKAVSIDFRTGLLMIIFIHCIKR